MLTPQVQTTSTRRTFGELMTQPPADWYPDPQHHGVVRYWDGTQWTDHVHEAAPATATGPIAGHKHRMSGGMIAVIAVACALVGIFVIAMIAAVVIPVTRYERTKESNHEAYTTVSDIGTAVAHAMVDSPDGMPSVEQVGSDVVIRSTDGPQQTVALEPGVDLGGFTAQDEETWCVWVTSSRTMSPAYQYSTWGGLEAGDCSR